jgi:hypothetical protein
MYWAISCRVRPCATSSEETNQRRQKSIKVTPTGTVGEVDAVLGMSASY